MTPVQARVGASHSRRTLLAAVTAASLGAALVLHGRDLGRAPTGLRPPGHATPALEDPAESVPGTGEPRFEEQPPRDRIYTRWESADLAPPERYRFESDLDAGHAGGGEFWFLANLRLPGRAVRSVFAASAAPAECLEALPSGGLCRITLVNTPVGHMSFAATGPEEGGLEVSSGPGWPAEYQLAEPGEPYVFWGADGRDTATILPSPAR